MNDPIDRQAAIDAMCELMHHWFGGDPKDEVREINRELGKLPSVQQKKGKWEEREVLQTGEVELQSARCSACGLYHTTPYMYYFSNYKYCPNCGARMVNEDE